MKRFTAAGIICAIICSLSLCSCSDKEQLHGKLCNVKAGIVSENADKSETYNQLTNGIIANIDVTALKKGDDFSACDIIFLDKMTDDSQKPDIKSIEEYVKNGGSVVLDNSLIPLFSNKMLGASEIVPISGIPADLEFGEVEEDLLNISELLYDYTFALKGYTNYEKYLSYNYGYGIIPSTAVPIASFNGTGIYTVNNYGKGYVFITNPLLPSDHTVSYLVEGENGEPLAFSTTAAENLLRSYYAEYVSKKKFGFAVERTFGSFATRPAAWELHYEDITGVENNALETFSRMCMEKGQMPSYTTARNIYTWFKRAESVTYMLGSENGFTTDTYENAYCSGTHIVSSGEWLELDYYDKTDSYFEDNKEYIKRAYPCPVDFNKDGKLDMICGSADGNFYYFEGYGMKDNYEMSIATLLTDTDGNPLNVGTFSSPVMFDINGDGEDEIISGAEDGVIRAFRRLKTNKNPSSLVFEAMGEILHTSLPDSMLSCGDLTGDGITDIAVGSRTGELRVYPGTTNDGWSTVFSDSYIPVVSQESWVSPCIYNGELYSGSLEGYIAHYNFDGNSFVFDKYLECDYVSRRGDRRITIGMNSVPRFADINSDGTDDLICGALEYGMAYPIDSPYFPYSDELTEQFKFCREYNIYMGVHGFTHKYATPEQEKQELEYHKKAFDKLHLKWEGLGANQHTWFTSKHGYDGSGINGYNPSYNGTFKAQHDSGLLWNSGSTLPESSAVPQTCAENALPLPVYMPDEDFLLLETSNTPHGKGEYSYTSVKYDMPLLFYNHCDYIYSNSEDQLLAVDKVGDIVQTYNYVFVGEDQMAKSVSAAYNSDIKAYIDNEKIILTSNVRDESIGLYDKKYTDCVGVKIVFASGDNANNYTTDANVWNIENNAMYLSLDKPVTLTKNVINDVLNIKQINIPSEVKLTSDTAEITFNESGLMYVRVGGVAQTDDKDWTIRRKDGDTIFMKFGQAQKLKIKR